MMETSLHPRGTRVSGGLVNGIARRGRGSKNKTWTASSRGGTESERWERGGHRGGGRGRGSRGHIASRGGTPASMLQEDNHSHDEVTTDDEDHDHHDMEEEEHVDYQELIKAREEERKRAIAEGKMDDPLVPKRLDQAITMVGTCVDMCPRFERYRRERENNLTEWEVVPGTKRVDHKKAVKMYERAAGDKTLPSDLRPPHVLKRTLDYLFHDLMPRGGFNATFSFIRDRSRAVRSDFTMQHETGPIAIECHDRCARYHILALHIQRDQQGFSIALEEQLLMNTLQSLKEFYEDQRGRYESSTELEMRVYHRLIHIRDQRERHDDLPAHIRENPVFELITRFRQHVQARSAPITKNSALVVGAEGMTIFGELAQVLRQENNTVMIFLVACILERLFGKGAVQDNLDDIRGDLSLSDVIDGTLTPPVEDMDDVTKEDEPQPLSESPTSIGQSTGASWPAPAASVFGPPPSSSIFGAKPSQSIPVNNAFSNLVATPNAFGSNSVFGQPPKSVSGTTTAPAPGIGIPHSSSALQDSPSGAKQSPFGATTFSSAALFGSSFPNSTPDKSSVMAPSNSSSGSPQKTSTFLPSVTQPLDPGAPSFVPSTRSPSALQSISNGLNVAPDIPITQPLRPTFVGIGGASSSLFSTPPPGPLPSTISLPTPAAEQPPESTNSLVSKQQTLWDFPSTSSPQTRPPRINTNLSGIAAPVPSPKQPPLLKRAEPISLPPTTPSTPQLPSIKFNKSLQGFPSFQTMPLSNDMLSPLNLTPFVETKFPFPTQPESPLKATVPSGSPPPSKRVWSKTKALEKVSSFSARSLVVKECFALWRKRTNDKADYLEAVRRSDEYSKKVHRERMLTDSAPVSPPLASDRKRRISGISPESSHRKRARKRLSGQYVPPRTDEDLVRRLKENHGEHERRWAQGTFLQTLRAVVTRSGPAPSPWRTWLSMNPDNDGTAIWLERKFDVPSSGRWISEYVFSMALSADPSPPPTVESPGLIIFECTPLEGLDDELEKKYRILDDCSRLRDVILALPVNRHYIPSLLLIIWTENHLVEVGSDLRDMVAGLLQEKIIKNHSSFLVSSSGKDLDEKFSDIISSMQLDTRGELVQSITGKALFRSFSSLWNDAISEWVENCTFDDQFDWLSYGDCLDAAIRLLGVMARHVFALSKGGSDSILIPPLQTEMIQDADSAYSTIIPWLNRKEWNGDATEVLNYIRSHKNLGMEFPAITFCQYLPGLATAIVERATGRDLGSTLSVVKDELSVASQQFEGELQSENDKLIELRTVRNSKAGAKRRMSASAHSPHKRARTSFEDDAPSSPSPNPSFIEESPPSPPSPSPSVSTSVGGGTKAIVTVGMLRELTRSVMKSYES